MIDNRLVMKKKKIGHNFTCLTEHDSYHMLYFTVCIWSDMPEQTVYTQMRRRKRGVSSAATLFATPGYF